MPDHLSNYKIEQLEKLARELLNSRLNSKEILEKFDREVHMKFGQKDLDGHMDLLYETIKIRENLESDLSKRASKQASNGPVNAEKLVSDLNIFYKQHEKKIINGAMYNEFKAKVKEAKTQICQSTLSERSQSSYLKQIDSLDSFVASKQPKSSLSAVKPEHHNSRPNKP